MNHIILIGFKHVGKSALGARLAESMGREFVDLDIAVEKLHTARSACNRTCREIVLEFGEPYFRALEHEALSLAMRGADPMVISLGGGTPIDERNRSLIAGHRIIHVTCDRGNVFEKIMIHGRPAILPPEEDLLSAFRRLWDEREAVYVSLAHHRIENNGSLDAAVLRAMAICMPAAV